VIHQTFKCGIGKDATPTPVGIFMVKRKIIDPPCYYNLTIPEKYGSCVLELNISGKDDRDGEFRPYCIHGHASDDLLDTKHTMGCITLSDSALKLVFNHVEKGEDVVVWFGNKDDVLIKDIPNWRRIQIWPPPENSVSYRCNRPLLNI
jgi:lipoprotein-anchoring transpeptidase ErfK/SrfK